MRPVYRASCCLINQSWFFADVLPSHEMMCRADDPAQLHSGLPRLVWLNLELLGRETSVMAPHGNRTPHVSRCPTSRRPWVVQDPFGASVRVTVSAAAPQNEAMSPTRWRRRAIRPALRRFSQRRGKPVRSRRTESPRDNPVFGEVIAFQPMIDVRSSRICAEIENRFELLRKSHARRARLPSAQHCRPANPGVDSLHRTQLASSTGQSAVRLPQSTTG